jgi:hypothetical protein
MRYLKYLSVPLAALLLAAIQLVILVSRSDLPALRVEVLGQQRLLPFIDATSRRSAVASSVLFPGAEPGTDQDGAGSTPDKGLHESSDLLVVDLPFVPDTEQRHAAGPFDTGLDRIRNRTIAGLQTAIGFNCLAGTENPRLAAELGSWTGAGMVSWIGLYLGDLSSTDQLPRTVLQAWEAANGRVWDYRGAGVVLHSPQDNRVVVLRRGVELDRKFLSVSGNAAGINLDSLLGGYFAILPQQEGGTVLVTADFGFLAAGQKSAEQHGIPARFPLVIEKDYGLGRVWTLALDLFAASAFRPGISLYPAPALEAARSLDEPSDDHARFTRLTVPIWRALSLAALDNIESAAQAAAVSSAASAGSVAVGSVAGSSVASSSVASSSVASSSVAVGSADAAAQDAHLPRIRAGERYLERLDSKGTWQPWFVKGINLGPATPGHWFTEPPTDDTIYLGWFESMAAAGFDTIRVYTLLPPAFYRALTVWNHAAVRNGRSEQLLYLIQEIWPEEGAPGHDLGDPAYLQAYLEESDRTIDAVFGRADIAERQFRAWGQYRADASPWLAAVLVGRELEPEEVLATAAARPGQTFTGNWFSVGPGWPVESVLATMADRAASRIAELGGRQLPIGFVSWPTLDVLYHPAEWTAGSSKAPFNDRASVDFRAIKAGPDNKAGFFTAYHIYPNYPDFMIRSARYELPGDQTGYLRYAAYIEELLGTQEGIPLLVAEFGLATGYGTAHLHPAGLDHGGLSEQAQAEGLVGLFRTIAGSGAAGGVVFQWADEWAKKTWTTETYMIPYDRNPLWHNTIDPEQNYGIMAWMPTTVSAALAQSAAPAHPAAPAQSAAPAQPAAPAQSAAPAQPAAPAQSAAQAQLQFSVQAAVPTTAADQAEPGALLSWSDPAWLYIQVPDPRNLLSLSPGADRSGSTAAITTAAHGDLAPSGDETTTTDQLILDLGLDVVPGRTGEYRLYPGGPRAPQGSEFIIRAVLQDGRLHEASLLVHVGYNRGGGKLFPVASDVGGFTRILTLVNGKATTREGRSFASLWEDGSFLPVGPQGLAMAREDGSLLFRLPWSRLNFSDPSQLRILLDPIRDARGVLTRDRLKTTVIDSIGLWAHVRSPGQSPLAYLPDRDNSTRIRLTGWEEVQAELKPKRAHQVLADFLPAWDATAEVLNK